MEDRGQSQSDQMTSWWKPVEVDTLLHTKYRFSSILHVMISLSVLTTLLLLLHSTKSDKSENISHSTNSVSISVNHTQDKTIMNTKEGEGWPQKEILANIGMLD